MAEEPDKESKTEEPTEKRIRDAVEKGNVPFSREAATLAALLGLLLISSFFVTGSVTNLSVSLRRYIDSPEGWSLENGADVMRLVDAAASDMARLLIPFVIILATAGVLASILQNSPRLVLDRIQPDLSRISIAKGWKRIFGAQGQIEFLKSLFKLGVIILVGYFMVRKAQYDVTNAMIVEPTALPALIHGMATGILSTVSVAVIVLVAADLVWSRIFWQRNLRMSRQEIKDELKQADGDPILKARMRSLARDRARRRMIAAVPRATVVITNPTHFAVALRYVREEGGAPLVVAKGQDLIALRIREIATQHAVPIVENKELARALYKNVEVDKMIPPEFYKAVAEIVFYLFARQAQTRAAG